MARRTALEALVATMSIAELADRSGRSVEDIVDWAMLGRSAGPKSSNGTSKPPAGKSTSASAAVDTRTAKGRVAFDGAVLDTVRTAPGPIGAADIRRAVGGTPLQVRAALNRLIESGTVSYQGRARATRYQVS